MASSINLTSFLITLFWVGNLSSKIFRGSDFLEDVRYISIPKVFTLIITLLLLLRYAMNSQFAQNFSQRSIHAPFLHYLNLITKTNFWTLVLNGLYLIVMTVYINDLGERGRESEDDFRTQLTQSLLENQSSFDHQSPFSKKSESTLHFRSRHSLPQKSLQELQRSSFGVPGNLAVNLRFTAGFNDIPEIKEEASFVRSQDFDDYPSENDQKSDARSSEVG